MYYSTSKEMEKLDRIAVLNGLNIIQMMELAGWRMVELFKKLRISSDKKISVICGNGNKGGDGLSAVRHLVNYGWNVSVVLVSRRLKPDPMRYLFLLEKMKLPIIIYPDDKEYVGDLIINSSDIVIDSLIGYHLSGYPRGVFAELINLINDSRQLGRKIISYDIPTGLDATTGECFKPCVEADATLTLALPKKAFKTKIGAKISGRIYLGDIGIPGFLYKELSQQINFPFKNAEGIIRIN